ncbi:uncharacterized protein EAE98_001884 [Botrytis deweyae]|uniref:Nephrocystin 3-like N-terminal domain-containing protein n=1 Tax=Botrytis deweyae TaxID=2478750 RepID=A0ABQ7IZ45_9HELO|nr:uncharacterized protein EAE98_001884 [Botrytis deweyae]KAF7937570.1 hypothetical protein EAE98_001884 [Botrytis deweyae]
MQHTVCSVFFGISMSVFYGEGRGIREAGITVFSQTTKSDIVNFLRFDKIDDRLNNIQSGHSRTCKWLLTSSVYLEWLSDNILPENHRFFWIRSKPGSGKSTLTKFAFLELKKTFPGTPLLSFFFNARGTIPEKSILGLYRSLLVQLFEICPDDQQNNFLDIPTLGHGTLEERTQSDSKILRQLLVQML